MTILQGILMVLSLYALFYQFVSVMTLAGLYAYAGKVTIKSSLRFAWALCIMVEAFFIITFVDFQGGWW